MAYEFYVAIKGSTQGQFKAESPRTARKDKWIAGLSYMHTIKSPRDIATGQASGKRQHGAISVVKEWGAATPQILTALCTNEVLPEVLFEFMKTNKNGEEYVYHTVKLTNATVSNIKQMTGLGVESSSSAKHTAAYDSHELEAVSFTYQRIEVENKDGKTLFVDDWHAQGG